MRKNNEGMDKGQSHLSRYRLGYCSVGSLAIACLVGCAQIKKMALIGGVTSATAGAASALGVATVPTALASGVAASVTSAYVAAKTPSTGDKMHTAASCAETNFWDVIQSLFETAGWLLILVILVPMVLGWILPGPLERRKKK
jgi:hypothetical protein